ncbi:enoyl-CoA hydratase/carnithine racemase [Hypoxylon fuscum]|nr:enoyl-CoA hydratase/carnithine racemase [Hypoxylon fuscum]
MSSKPQLPPSITTPPPEVSHTLVSFPVPQVLLVTLNRPQQLNCIPKPQHFELEQLWEWYDAQPSLRCAVVAGAGRAFCAGADLKDWDRSHAPSAARDSRFPRGGFGGLSNRDGLKPVIAAVHGVCFGGGLEMALNCDMVVAGAGARFALPEVTIGVTALAGALPRLARCVGRHRAHEMALAGAAYDAPTMRAWGVVNEVVAAAAEGGEAEAVVARALDWAARIAANSPDAVAVSREGLKLGWEGVGPAQATDLLIKGWYARIDRGENMVEGVRSFVEKRKPVWKDSKL